MDLIDVKKLIKLLDINSEKEYKEWVKSIKFKRELLQNGILNENQYIERLLKDDRKSFD